MLVAREFIRGYRTLHFAGPCVTVLGSTSAPEDHPAYQLAHAVGAAMGEAGLTVMTGGGAGVAEAASRGAREAGAPTIACTTESTAAATSRYVDRVLRLRHAFVRETLMTKYSVGLVALPGDLETLDRVLGSLTLSVRGDLRDFPVVLMDERTWRPLLEQIEAATARQAPQDGAGPRLLLVTDSADQATRFILHHAMNRFGSRLQPGRARWILGESAWRGRAHRPRRAARRGRWFRSPERKRP